MPVSSLPSIGPSLPPLPASYRLKQSGTSNSYIITNRQDPTGNGPIVPLSNNNLWWYMSAEGINDPSASHYLPQSTIPTTTPPDNFISNIVAQLNQQADQQQTNPQLTIFIHGLGTDWTDAINGTATLGAMLESKASYKGLVIGFDWPSYGGFTSGLDYASSYPPNKTSGSIRDNINGSVGAFGHMVDFVQNLRTYDGLNKLVINIVCHSEGNYMAMLGMAGMSSVSFDHIVLLAADINNGAFQTPESGLVGQANQLCVLSDDVTVYFTNNDDILGGSLFWFDEWHNPLFSGRLGLTGPSYNQGKQQSNMYSVDCSAVINKNNKKIFPWIKMHDAYFCLQQVLEDIAATLNGMTAASVPNRTKACNSNAYFMQLGS